MTSGNEYRRRAAEAEKAAYHTHSNLDWVSWLRVAQGWLSLIRKRRPAPTEAFDAEQRPSVLTTAALAKPRSKAESVGGRVHGADLFHVQWTRLNLHVA